MSQKKKVAHGAYFTPPNIAKAINQRILHFWLEKYLKHPYSLEQFEIDYSNNRSSIQITSEEREVLQKAFENLKILDPSVGGGVFLLEMLPILFFISKIFLYNPVNTTEGRIKFVKQHLFGWDIQEDSINAVVQEISRWIIGKQPFKYRNEDELKVGLKNDEKDNVINRYRDQISSNFSVLNTLYAPISNHFTILVGNPPFGNILSDQDRKQMKKIYQSRPNEIAELFLEKGLQLLNPKTPALLGFIVPKTIAYYQQWAVIREIIFQYKIKEIIDLGIAFPEVNLEQIALIVDNSQSTDGENLFIQLSQAIPHKKSENKQISTCGKLLQERMAAHRILIFSPLSELTSEMCTEIEHSCDFLPNFAPIKGDRSIFMQYLTRSFHVSDAIKEQFESGSQLYINKVPDVGKFGIDRIYQIKGNSHFSKFLRPKLLFKVYRGSRIGVIADPLGNIVTTQKIVNFFPNPRFYPFIFGMQALLNSRPPSFYLQATIYSQTTESSRVLDPFYAQFIPLPKLTDSEWELFTSWGKLATLSYYLSYSVLFPKIQEIIEIYALKAYFPMLFSNNQMNSIILPNLFDPILINLFQQAKLNDFEKYYLEILATKIIPLPVIHQRFNPTIKSLDIWSQIQINEINQSIATIETLYQHELQHTKVYRELINFLKK